MKYSLLLLLLLSCSHPLAFEPAHEGLPQHGQWKTTLAVGDVNNDGRSDLAAIGRKGNATATVWLSTEQGWQPANTGITSKQQCGIGTTFHDINSDGYLDVAYAQHCGGPLVYLGDGTGQWRNYSYGLPHAGVNTIALSDLNNNGTITLITQGATIDNGFTVYELHNHTWQPVNTNLPATLKATPLSLTIKDVNNDGLPDILSATQDAIVYYNLGNYTFSPQTLGTAYYLAAEHLDDDNQIDYVLSGPQLAIIYGDNTQHNLGPCAGGIALTDINNDNNPDIIANCGDIKIYLGPDWTQHTIPGNGQPYGIQAADFNNDGRLDIAAASDGYIKTFLKQ